MIIGIMSPKGGCGKSTTALVIASALATDTSIRVALVDADPRQSLARVWQKKRSATETSDPPFALHTELDEDKIIDRLETLGNDYDVVIVDLEGVAGLMSSYVASTADFCVVPMRPSALDGDAAGAALRLIGSAGKAAKRSIPAYVLITQTDAAITTRSHREVLAELDGGGVKRFQVELMKRAPYERMMSEGRSLFELADGKSAQSARANAMALAKEVALIAEQVG